MKTFVISCSDYKVGITTTREYHCDSLQQAYALAQQEGLFPDNLINCSLDFICV